MDEAFLKALLEKLRWLAPRRVFWLLLLGAIIVAYYGSYYRHDLRFRDEGGTIALGAQRLLAGERPFREVILNYNVLWYYPVVWLFKEFGVNFVLMRVWFFALSAVAAFIAFFTVTRAGRQPWIGFCVALLCVLVPGMIFKNYIPFLVVTNSFILMLAALKAPGSRGSYGYVCLGGFLVGITYLIRIDLGLFFTLLWLGLHVLRLLDRGVRLKAKVAAALTGTVLTVGLAALVHAPVLDDAERRGFEEPFTEQYRGWTNMIEREVRTRLGYPAKRLNPVHAKGAGAESTPVFWNKDILKRNAWRDFTNAKDFDTRSLVLLTYLPILLLAAVLGWTLVCLVGGRHSADPDAYRQPLAALVLIGGALTAFPQFFFFRPDAPHLSEFSPGYWVAVVGSALLLGAHEGSWRTRGRPLARLLLIAIVAHAALFLVHMIPNRWTGTIEARWGRDQHFEAENGVDVFVSRGDLPGLQGLCKVVAENSNPGDYLVAYPYHPTINVMTNRRTYEKDVYVDNATRTRHWDEEAIGRFIKYKPAVIVLSDWDVNGHDGSRFSVWAAPTKAWIKANYVSRGTFSTDLDAFEVFTLRK